MQKIKHKSQVESRVSDTNMNIQNRGDVSIRTGFIYAKNYLKKMFYFYSFFCVD